MRPSAPGADGDLLEADAVALGERRPQAVRAAVRVAVQLGGRARDRLERLPGTARTAPRSTRA